MVNIKQTLKIIPWNRVAKTIGLSGVAIALLSVGILFFINTDTGRNHIVDYINQSRSSENKVHISSLNGSLFSEFTVPALTLADNNGVWLELSDIHVKWSPAALLLGRAEISALNITKLDFLRAPATTAPETEEDDTLTLPSLPIDLDIANYGVNGLKIGESFTDMATTFKLQGALKLTNADGLLAKVNLVNTGGTDDNVKIDMSYPANGSDLIVDLLLTAPQNGFFLSLINADLNSDFEITLFGTGPINNWIGKFDAKLGSENIAHADIRHANKDFSLQSETSLGRFVPTEFKPLVSSPVITDLAIRPSENDEHLEFTALIKNNIAEFNADSLLFPDQPGITDKVNFTLKLDDPAALDTLIAPAFVAPSVVIGNVTDISTAPKLMIRLNDAHMGIKEQIAFSLSSVLEANLLDHIIDIRFDGNIHGMEGAAIQSVAPLTASGLSISLNGQYDKSDDKADIRNFVLGNDHFEIQANGMAENNAERIKADVITVISDLTSISSSMELEQEISGSLSSSLNISGAGKEEPLRANLKMDAQNLSFGMASVDEVFGRSPGINGSFLLSSDGAINVEQLSMESDFVSIAADAFISDQQNIDRGNFTVRLKALENLKNIENTFLNGTVEITGTMSGNTSDPSLILKTGIDNLDIQGLMLSNFETTISADHILSNTTGKVIAGAQSNFGILQVDIPFFKNGQKYLLPEIKASLGAYNTSGNLDIEPASPLNGSFRIATDKNAAISNDFSGNISLDMVLSDENGNQKLDIQGQLEELKLLLPENRVLTLQSADFQTDALLAEGNPRITLASDIRELMHPAFQIKQSNINIEQQGDGMEYDITASGTNTMPYQVDISGTVFPDTNRNGQNITASVTGIIDDTDISFNHQKHIYVSDDTILVPPFTLLLGAGQIKGEFNKNNDEIRSSTAAQNANLGFLSTFFPDIPITGLLSGSLGLNGNQSSLNGMVDIRLSEIDFVAQPDIQTENTAIEIKGTVNENKTELSGILTQTDNFKADFSAVIPIKINPVRFDLSIADNEPITGALKWEGETSQLWPAFNLIDHDLSGELKADFKLGGTIREPDMDGNIILAGGRYENMQTGFVASDIELDATVLNRHLTLNSFSANDGENGKINAQASVTIEPDLNYEADIELILENAKLVRQPELSIVASSDLAFIKNTKETKLQGTITVENANIGAIEQNNASFATLEVTEINSEGNVIEQKQTENKIGPVDLDLKLNVPGKLFIRSYGLDSEWQADLTVKGTSDAPIIGGTASQIRGYFEFSGKRFNITKGAFSFPGDSSNDPVIDIMAEHQLADMVANLHIFGPASSPQLEMTSNPYLPENEVMARILFGTSVAQLTAVEAVQLASAVHSLSNGGGPGIMGGIRRVIGVDRFSIDNDASREYGTTITGGKYLADNVYVEVSTAPATGQTATSVEVGLTRNLSLVTRRTLDHDNNLSVRWFWDY